jgi:hypothetical protein
MIAFLSLPDIGTCKELGVRGEANSSWQVPRGFFKCDL